jgi:hypothetical protein
MSRTAGPVFGASVRAQAGALGAAMATLGARSRAPGMPSGLYARMQPPSLDRLSQLLPPRGTNSGLPEVRLARMSAVAQMDSVPGRFKQHIHALLADDERPDYARAVARRRDLRREHVSICRHCATCQCLRYRGRPPGAVIVNHGARIETDFDADSNVSSASISNFQIFVPTVELAKTVIKMAHPLRWQDAAPAMFQRSDAALPRPANRGGGWTAPALDGPAREAAIDDWRRRGEGHVYENVGWAWNEHFGSKAENIIRISHLSDASDGSVLRYAYALEKCLITNFGVAWERGGLDIDTGSYQGAITEFDRLSEADVPPNAPPGYPHEQVDPLTVDRQRTQAPEEVKAERFAALKALGQQLEVAWKRKPVLLTISAEKKLRYTRMQNSPDELRAFLNWTSPALLFVFLNRSICQYVFLLPNPLDP